MIVQPVAPAPTPSPRVHPPTSPIRPRKQLDKIDMTDPATVAAVVAIGVLGLGHCLPHAKVRALRQDPGEEQ